MAMRAVKKCPKNPDFSRMETYSEHMVDPAGGIRLGNFDRYTADRQKVEAGILKQGRMAREEEEAEGKRVRSGKGEGETTDPPTDAKNTKGKKK